MAERLAASYEDYLKNVEKYKDYQKNTYLSMSLEEKIDFFDGIHTNQVPMFDENGNTLYTLWDYGEISGEFIRHPEMFSITDISKFLEMLDDACEEPSFMGDTLKVIRSIIRFYGKEAAVYLLTHLSDVPQRGKEYGLYYSLSYLITDDAAFPYLKEAAMSVDPSTQNFLHRIIKGEMNGVPKLSACAEGSALDRIHELETITAN